MCYRHDCVESGLYGTLLHKTALKCFISCSDVRFLFDPIMIVMIIIIRMLSKYI